MILKKEYLNKMNLIYFLVVFLSFFLNSCSSVRDIAGVARKSIDEFTVIENPPLVIPPDFNLLPPEQLENKNIDNFEREFARDILFGLDENERLEQKEISTMYQILSKSNALGISSSIRDEIDEDYAQEINTDGILNIDFENEVEVLDAIKESERIREKNYEGKSISSGDIPIKKKIIKKKRKKRFFFF